MSWQTLIIELRILIRFEHFEPFNRRSGLFEQLKFGILCFLLFFLKLALLLVFAFLDKCLFGNKLPNSRFTWLSIFKQNAKEGENIVTELVAEFENFLWTFVGVQFDLIAIIRQSIHQRCDCIFHVCCTLTVSALKVRNILFLINSERSESFENIRGDLSHQGNFNIFLWLLQVSVGQDNKSCKLIDCCWSVEWIAKSFVDCIFLF